MYINCFKNYRELRIIVIIVFFFEGGGGGERRGIPEITFFHFGEFCILYPIHTKVYTRLKAVYLRWPNTVCARLMASLFNDDSKRALGLW